MARLIPLLLLLGVGIILMLAQQNRPTGRRDSRAYRPRRGSARGSGSKSRGSMDEPFVVTRRDIEGLRDAYSGAALDDTRALVRCDQCLAFYHAESVAILVRENKGRCAGCGGTNFRAVTLAGS